MANISVSAPKKPYLLISSTHQSTQSSAEKLSCLTRWELVYKYIIHWNHVLSCKFHATLELHNSPVKCARELSKPSKDSANLPVCTEKKFLVLGFIFFCGWCHEWGSFLAILAKVTWPWVQLLDQCFWDPWGPETRFSVVWNAVSKEVILCQLS